MTNREIAAVLFNISTMLREQRANPFRIRAYRRAARNVLRARHSLAEKAAAGEPLGVPLLGKRLTAKITQLALEGHCDFYDELVDDLPGAEQALLKVPGIGPLLAHRVAADLGAREAGELVQRAAGVGLQRVWGIGPKRAALILDELTRSPQEETSSPPIVREGNVLYVQESFWRDGTLTQDRAA